VIAMSTRGQAGAGRWALGGVTDRVLRSAPVPVLTVRPPDEAPDRTAMLAGADRPLAAL
jgi:hypothetical protein